MKVGDKVKRVITCATLTGEVRKPVEGTVIYIHPRGRFHRVLFEFGNGNSFIETFLTEGGSL